MTSQSLLLNRLEQYGPREGINETNSERVIVVRESEPHAGIRTVYEPFLVVVGKGEKYCYVGDQKYAYGAQSGLAVLLPMPVQTEIIGATEADPFLAAVIALDLDRMSDILLKIERAGGFPDRIPAESGSGIFSFPLSERLIQAVVRLFDALADKMDSAILPDLILDEIHYLMLRHEQGALLRQILHQRGYLQQVSRAVDFIHQNVDKPVSVEGLADMVHMSRATFFEHFKAVMHVSPLQYAKSVKLFEAHKLIREGKNAGEAGYLVGYNSPAQFSREYKRHFGYTPSSTLKRL